MEFEMFECLLAYDLGQQVLRGVYVIFVRSP